MKIIKATMDHLADYNKIYREYAIEQAEFLDGEESDIKKIYETMDFSERNSMFLQSEYCFVQLAIDDSGVRGFMECNVSNPDTMFEQKYIYLSNFYFEKSLRSATICFKFGNIMFKSVEEWARKMGISFLCNDILSGNDVMVHVNKYFGFKPYKVRYLKTI